MLVNFPVRATDSLAMPYRYHRTVDQERGEEMLLSNYVADTCPGETLWRLNRPDQDQDTFLVYALHTSTREDHAINMPRGLLDIVKEHLQIVMDEHPADPGDRGELFKRLKIYNSKWYGREKSADYRSTEVTKTNMSGAEVSTLTTSILGIGPNFRAPNHGISMIFALGRG